MDIKNLPHVTVEQVSKFRDAALQALNKKDAEIAESNRTWKEYVDQVMDDGGKQIRLKGDEVKHLQKEIAELRKALGAMLTEMGMDEDEHNKPTFNQARRALEK